MCRFVRILSGLCLIAVMPRAAGAQHDMAHMSSMTDAVTRPLEISDTREGSGTSWLPDATPMRASMTQKGPWMLMAHGRAFAEFIDVTGPRGDRQGGSINWFMTSARRPLGRGDVAFRAMFSLEPVTVGKCGYPDVVQSGESCNGQRLHDRQHPHDLFMELAADYRRPLSDHVAMDVYAGVVGEPALGPGAYPHRPSAALNPFSPVSHHWLDSSHVSFGVVTGALYGRRWKTEVSAFNGREPDDGRYGVDLARLDSWSGRAWWLPSERWAMQMSSGRLNGAEHDEDGGSIAVDRTTASVTYHRPAGAGRLWAMTAAWGTNGESGHHADGRRSSAALAEVALDVTPATSIFVRAEVVGKSAHDLDVDVPDTTRVFAISKLQAGATRVLGRWRALEASAGASAGFARLPLELEPAYGRRTPAEFAVFLLIQPRTSATGHEVHR